MTRTFSSFAKPATLAATLLATTAITHAHADDLNPVEKRFWGSFEAGAMLTHGDSADIGFTNVEPETGFSVKGELGATLGSTPYSVRGALRYSRSGDDDDTVSNTTNQTGPTQPVPGFPGATFSVSSVSTGTFDSSYDESAIMFDLDVGRDVGLGNERVETRLFAGIRVARFQADETVGYDGGFVLSYNVTQPGFPPATLTGLTQDTTSTITVEQRFTGIGPRIGADLMIPVGQKFQFDLSAAGGVLFGERRVKSKNRTVATSTVGSVDLSTAPPTVGAPTTSGPTTNTVSVTETEHAVIPTFSLAAAFGIRLTDTALLSVGYQAEGFVDVFSENLDAKGGIDRIQHGPFARMTVEFGG